MSGHRLAIALILAALAATFLAMDEARAQNPANAICPDRPAADNSFACANTRFVTGNTTLAGVTYPIAPLVIGDILYANTTTSIARIPDVAAGALFVSGGVGAPAAWSFAPVINGAPLTINPTASSLTNGLNINHTISGTTLAGAFYNNLINIASDSADATATAGLIGFSVQYRVGAGAKSGRDGIQTLVYLNGVPSVAGPYTGGSFQAQADHNANGSDTGAGARGALFGINPVAQALTGATFFGEVTGGEINVGIQAGASARARVGLRIVELSLGTIQGAVFDSALQFTSQVGAVGWNCLICIDASYAQAPLKTTGSVIATAGTQTWNRFIDIGGGVTITDAIINAPNFRVTGVGSITSVANINMNATASLSWNTRAVLQSPADSQIVLLNNAVNNFDRLMLGGITSSFPAIKRNAAALNFRLADDSADANITARAINASGIVNITLALPGGGGGGSGGSVGGANDGLQIVNNTGATATDQQWSPNIHLIAQGWNTVALASQTVDWLIQAQTVAGNPVQSVLALATQINGGGYKDGFAFVIGPSSGIPAQPSDTTQRYIVAQNSLGIAQYGVDSNTGAAYAWLASGTGGTIFGTATASDVAFYANNIKALSIKQGAALVNVQVYVRATQASTSTSTGGLRVDGGAGIAGDIFGGGIVSVVTGYRQGTMTAGRVLRSDGTNFISAQLAFADLTSTPTTLAGYGITSPLPVAQGGTNCAAASITCFNNITGFSAAGTTGTTSTSLVFSTSPTLVTPTLGAFSATTGQFGSTAPSGNNIIQISIASGTGRFIDISNTAGEAQYGLDASGNVYAWCVTCNGTFFGTQANKPVDFYTNNVQQVRIQTSGGVSIGTTTDPGVGALLTNTFIKSTTYHEVGTKIRATGAAPALTSCGTSPTIEGSDLSGTVTMGTGSPTGCVITFNAAYTGAPRCTVSWRVNIASMQYAVSTTAITLTQTATSSNVVDYICTVRSGGWLLKRDLDPAANDNTPAFMNQAA